MKRSTIAGLLACLAGLLLATATVDAAARPFPPTDAGRVAAQRLAQRATVAQPPLDSPSNDNDAAVLYPHFGSAASGLALIETWTHVEYSDLALPVSNQGFGRAVRTFRVKRIALRVVLHTRGGTTNSDVSGPTYNNGTLAGNPRVFNAISPILETGGLVPTPAFCFSWTEVVYAIRWDDDTLTSGKVLTAPHALVNANCYFTGPTP